MTIRTRKCRLKPPSAFLLVALTALCWCNHCQSGIQGQIDLRLKNELMEVLQQFEHAVHGKRIAATLDGNDADNQATQYEMALDQSGVSGNFRKTYEWHRDDGEQTRHVVEIALRTEFAIKNDLLQIGLDGKKLKTNGLDAVLRPSRHNFLGYLDNFAPVIGISLFDGLTFTQILESADVRAIESPGTGELMADKSSFGRYRFVFEKREGKYRLRSFFCDKGENDSFSFGDGQIKKVSDLRVNDSERFIGTGIEVRFSDSSGKVALDIPEKWIVTQRSTGASGTSFTQTRQVSVTELTDVGDEEFSFLSLESVDNCKAVNVRVVGKENVVYYLHQSKIRQAVDIDAERTIREFRDERDGKTDREEPAPADDCRLATKNSDDVILTHYLRTRHNVHCGIYSCLLGLASLGVDAGTASLISTRYMSDPNGSTAEDLVNAASDHGVSAFFSDRLTLGELRSSKTPVILLLEGNRRIEGSYHWILFLGEKNGMATIWDAPRPIDEVEYSDLLAEWRGAGVVLGLAKRPTGWLAMAVFDTAWPALLCLGIVLVVQRVSRRIFRESQRTMQNGWAQIAIIGVVTCVLVMAQQAVSEKALLYSRIPIASILFRATLGDFESVDADFVEANRDLMTIVDARSPHAYHSGHIQGAVNFPADATVFEIRDALENIPRSRPLIVYCESEQCSWDAAVASRLVNLGYGDIRLYKKGWRNWSSLDDFYESAIGP